MRRRKKGSNIVLYVAVVAALFAGLYSLLPQKSETVSAPVDNVAVTPPTSTEIPLPKVDSVPRDTTALPKVDSVPRNENASKSEEPAQPQTNSYSYVLNTNTMRIHKPGCSSVTEMNPKNRQPTNKSIEELEAEGYVKCKRCF